MESIILYSNGCPKCKVLKSKLENKKIEFWQDLKEVKKYL